MRLSGELEKFYGFQPVALTFVEGAHTNLFSLKNNKTLRQTLEHPRYAKLYAETLARYSDSLNRPLGEFLLDLKLTGDQFYKRFLNSYGDDVYSTFRVSDASFRRMKGVYAHVVSGEVVYVGRCRDALSKRIDHGYGKIHPKNCYLDGQATNCHLNARITKIGNTVELWLCPIDSMDEICVAERHLIRANTPLWNIHRFV
jgi:hypothetical protein